MTTARLSDPSATIEITISGVARKASVCTARQSIAIRGALAAVAPQFPAPPDLTGLDPQRMGLARNTYEARCRDVAEAWPPDLLSGEGIDALVSTEAGVRTLVLTAFARFGAISEAEADAALDGMTLYSLRRLATWFTQGVDVDTFMAQADEVAPGPNGEPVAPSATPATTS